MIRVEEISKSFNGKKAVDSLSFIVQEGETLVLLGTSGSGKTTTLRMINRLINPDEGSISIKGQNVMDQDKEQLRRGIGYVLQNYGLFPHYTVAENIAIVPKLLKWAPGKIAHRTSELLEKLQLPPAQYESKYPHQLSGGQKQRVGLARALAADPPILLMDEPFGALDPLTRMAVRKDFKDLDELNRKTIVLVTHDVQEAFALGDLVGLMDKGKLEQFGKKEELLFKPANAFVKDFLKHERLQLELQSITLRSVWDELPEATNSRSAIVNSLQSLWEVLEHLTGTVNTLSVVDEASGEIKEIDSEEVFALLKNYKTSTWHE